MRRVLGLLIVTCGAWALPWGCDDKPGPEKSPTPPPKAEWSAEEIARDPQGYLGWADARIQQQITERNQRLEALAKRRADVVKRQEALLGDIEAAKSVNVRLSQAYQRAEDEDRWPVSFAGHFFDRSRAKAIIDQTRAMVDERQPLKQAYEQALKKMDDAGVALRGDVNSLKRLREKLALDLERVRLNQGMEEIDNLRKTEAELASMGKTLSQMADDAATLSLTEPVKRVDLDTLLKP